jgi:hypothetical protein
VSCNCKTWACLTCNPVTDEETAMADHADFLNDLLKESKDAHAGLEEELEKKLEESNGR